MTTKTDHTAELVAAMLGNLGGINRRLARALSDKLGDSWFAAMRSAKTDAEARQVFESAVNEAIELIARAAR